MPVPTPVHLQVLCLSQVLVLLSRVSPAAAAIAIYVSPHTPLALHTTLKRWTATSSFELDFREVTGIADLDSTSRSGELAVDVLYNQLLSYHLKESVGDDGAVISGNGYEVRGARRLFVDEREELRAVLEVAKIMRLPRLCAIFRENVRVDFRLFEGVEVTSFTISDGSTLDTLTLLIKKQIKPKGFTLFLLWLPPSTLLAFFTAMQATRLDERPLQLLIPREASSFLFTSGSGPSFAETGPVFVLDEPCGTAVRPSDYLDCKLTSAVFADLPLNASFSVLNIVNGVPTAIGHVDQAGATISLTNFTSCTNHEEGDMSVIQLSFNNGTMNPSGEANTSERDDYQGALLAETDINQDRSVLDYHKLKINNVTFGLFDFQYNWTDAQIKATPRSRLGVAMISGEYSVMTIGVYQLLASVGDRVMMVGAGNTSPLLSSPRDFPLYSRVMMSDIYLSVLYSKIVRYYGWTHISVVYCDDMWSRGLYSLFLNETQKLGISIVNNETMRMIPSDMPDYRPHQAVFESIVNSKARVVILLLFGEALYHSIEALYDLGMRKGDIVFLAAEWLNPTLFALEDPVLLSKVRELCDGAIEVYPATYIGHIGEVLSQQYSDVYGIKGPVYACFYYDAVYLLAHALDYLVMSGGDYEKPEVLASAVRKTKFRGCSGMVTIEETSNDRSPMMYDIFNSRVYPNGSYEILQVGIYDPGGLLLFNFTTDVIWPGNSTAVPSDLRLSDFDCPFLETKVVSYTPGLILSVGLSGTIAVAMIGVTAGIWRKYWRKRAKSLNQKVEISLDDYQVFFNIWLEAGLYLLMGPYFRSWDVVLQFAGNLAGLNVGTLVDLEGVRYWSMLYAAFCSVLIWGSLLVVIRFEHRIKSECVYSCLESLAEKVLPLVGNLCFMPIISLLMDVYQCPLAVQINGEALLTSTFLLKDCYTACWTFPHTLLAVICFLVLLVFVPSAVYLRPSWQDLSPALHIDTSPAFIMLKTIYQIMVVLIAKTLKPSHSLAHSIVFASLTAGFLTWSIKIRPFGYSRASLWQVVSLLCVIWFAVLCAACEVVGAMRGALCLCAFLVGVGVIFGAAAVIQVKMFASLLFRPKGVPVVELFRFMFNRGRKYTSLFKKPAPGVTLSDNEAIEIRRVPISYSVSGNSESL